MATGFQPAFKASLYWISASSTRPSHTFRSKNAPGGAAAATRESTPRTVQGTSASSSVRRCSRPGGRSERPMSAMRQTAASASTSGSARCAASVGVTPNAAARSVRRCERSRGSPMRDHLQRVDPPPTKCASTRHALDEGAVERRVVRHDVAITDELDQPKDSGFDAGLTSEHLVGDARQLGDFRRDGNERVDEHREGADDLRAAHDCSSEFDDAISVRVVSRGLDVDDCDLVVETERGVEGTLGKRPVGRFDVFVRSGNEEGCEILGSHALRLARASDLRTHNGAPVWAPRDCAMSCCCRSATGASRPWCGKPRTTGRQPS